MPGDTKDGEAFLWGIAITLGSVWLYNNYIKKQPAPAPVVSQLPPAPKPAGLVEIDTLEGGTVWRLNLDSISGPQTARHMWIVADHTKDKSLKQRETQTLYRVNCDTTGYRTLKIVSYDQNGKTLQSAGPEMFSQADEYSPPDSRLGLAIAKGCDPALKARNAAPASK